MTARQVLVWMSTLIVGVAGLMLPSSTQAKSVELNWEAVPLANSYDLRIEDSSGKPLSETRIALPAWKGDITPGIYFYQVRALDALSRTGAWSEKSRLVVIPPPPEPVYPSQRSEVPKVGQTTRVRVTWQPAPGASRYRTRLSRSGQSLAENWSETHESFFEGLQDGEYEWTVSALIQDNGKTWETPLSSPTRFKVVNQGLVEPRLLSPKGELSRVSESSEPISFNWLQTPGAESYEICIQWSETGAPICKTVAQPNEPNKPVIHQEIPEADSQVFEWRVRPLLTGIDTRSIESKSEVEVVRAQTSEKPIGDLASGPGKLELRLGLAYQPGSVTFSSQAQSSSGTLNASSTHLDFGAQIDITTWSLRFQTQRQSLLVENQSFTLQNLQLSALPRHWGGRFRLLGPWTWSPNLGIRFQEHLLLYPDLERTVNGAAYIESQRFSALGPSAGIQLDRRILKSIDLRVQTQIHSPLLIVDGLPTGSSIQSLLESLAVDVSAGVSGWIRRGTWGWSVDIKAFQNAIRFQTPMNTSGGTEQTQQGGFAIQGGVLLRF
jgi:hypothetical protein